MIFLFNTLILKNIVNPSLDIAFLDKSIYNTHLLVMLSLILVISLLVCVIQKNPVYSVILLIFSFIDLSLIFGLIGSHFLSLLILFIYAGAISILFIFVFMIIDFRHISSKINFTARLIYLIFIMFLLVIIALVGSFNLNITRFYLPSYFKIDFFTLLYLNSELYSIGFTLFNYFFIHFLAMILILLTSMVSAVTIIINKTDLRSKFNSSNVIKASIHNINISVIK